MTIRLMGLATSVAAVTLLGTSQPGLGAAATAPALFPTANGRVTYKMSAGMMTGTTVITWIENGKKFRSETQVKATPPQGAGAPPGKTPPPATMKSWSVSDGKYLYQYGPMPTQPPTVQRIKLTPERIKRAASGMGLPGMRGGVHGKPIGKATLLGKSCEIREHEGSKVWLWKNLPLKAEIVTPINLTAEATRLEDSFKAPASTFKVPAGFKIVDQAQPAMRMNPDAGSKFVR